MLLTIKQVSESVSPGSTIFKLRIEDDDTKRNPARQDHKVELTNHKNMFELNANKELILKIGAKFDFETEPVYNLTSVVTDNGTPELKSKLNFQLWVSNVNERPYEMALSSRKTSN